MRLAAIPLMVCVAYYGVAIATVKYVHSASGIAPVWPANAIVLATVLLTSRGSAPWIIGAAMVGNLLTMLTLGASLPDPIYYLPPNILELAVATLGLRSSASKPGALSEPRDLLSLLLWAGLLAPGAGALLGSMTAWHLNGQPLGTGYLRWFLADSLGLLIFTPLFLSLFSGDMARDLRTMSRKRRVEFAGLMLFTAATAASLFLIARHPLLFLMIIPLMLTTFRAGWLGTQISLTIVAIIGGGATIFGHGPIVMQVYDPDMRVYGIQLYIATMLFIQIPIAATLGAREELIRKLRDSEQSLRMLAGRSPILLLAFDLAGRCERIVGTTNILLDRDAAQLVGGTFEHISQEGQYELRRAHNAALEDLSQSHAAEFRTVKVNDAWLEAVFRAHFDETGRCLGTIATIHDVTQRKNQELSLSRTAKTDSLTGLLNRAGFRSRLDHALLTATPGALSIAMIDVDRFKLINDNSGHQVGDVVLREIARRIASQVRSSDAVGRLGGDEFVILLTTPNWDRVQEICGRIVKAVNADPIVLPSGNALRTAISCGVARFQTGLSADDFLHEADVALYAAKRGGRNRVVAA
jgi:diguanylate cyclase (GGDEF)-like protein